MAFSSARSPIKKLVFQIHYLAVNASYILKFTHQQPPQSSNLLLSALKVSISNYSAQLIHTIKLTKQLPQVAPTRPPKCSFFLFISGNKTFRMRLYKTVP